MKRKLVEDAHLWWKWISVRCMIFSAAIQASWMYIPDSLKERAPDGLVNVLTITLMAIGVCGRLIKQGKCDEQDHSLDNDSFREEVGNRDCPPPVGDRPVRRVSSKKPHRSAVKKSGKRPH